MKTVAFCPSDATVIGPPWAAIRTGMAIALEDHPKRFNRYGNITVNQKKCPDINYKGVMQLIDEITSKAGQQKIADLKVEGQQMFFPSAQKRSEPATGVTTSI